MWGESLNILGSSIISVGLVFVSGILLGVILSNILNISAWKKCKEVYRNLNSSDYKCKVEIFNNTGLLLVIQMTSNNSSIGQTIFRLRKYKNGMVSYQHDILINSGGIKYVFPYQIYYSYKFNRIFKQIIQKYPSETLNSIKQRYGENVDVGLKIREGNPIFFLINKSPFKFLR